MNDLDLRLLQQRLDDLGRTRGWRRGPFRSWRWGPWTIAIGVGYPARYQAVHRRTGEKRQFTHLEDLVAALRPLSIQDGSR